MPESDPDSVIPAQLSFLAIYNPSLGPTDETIEDQIVFYTSRAENLRKTEDSAVEEDGTKPSESGRNERLRQIGLAQGMVSFASNFSEGKPLEYVETDRTRVVLAELEKDWWIVASIDLTRLPAGRTQTSSNEDAGSSSFQYSGREMGPSQLFIQQLRRAHSIFLLLHDFSLDDLYGRVGRAPFCLFLERFWEKFAWNWELLLTGNPIVEIYNGIKLAAGGELGIGVGEEEWGSGEREVLEDFVSRTDGLVDLVVSRFGESSDLAGDSPSSPKATGEAQWLSLDTDPRPADGIIFSGLGAVSRLSLSHISHWMEWIYRYGDAAYGIGRDPNSLRRRKPRRHRGRQTDTESGAQPSTPDRSHTPGIPRPLVMAAPQATPEVRQNHGPEPGTGSPSPSDDQRVEQSGFGTETVMKYLTLGYGSSWGFSTKSPSPSPVGGSPPATSASAAGKKPSDTAQATGSQPGGQQSRTQNNTIGRFILGPRDDLDTLDELDEGSPEPGLSTGKPKSRIVHRTLHIRMANASDGSLRKLQAVIYVHQPFMFTFLFDSDTPSLSSASLYSSIHHQLGPLQKPLLASTSPSTALSRKSTSENIHDPNRRSSSKSQSVYDIVYDPSNLTIRSSIPNIPSINPPSQPHPTEPSTSPRTPSPSPSRPPSAPLWSRVESLAIHQRLLSTYIDTRSRPQELERTYKTNRGWWVVWLRIPHSTIPSQPATITSRTPSSAALSSLSDEHSTLFPHPQHQSQSEHQSEPQEAFIVHKASDYVSPSSHGRMSSGARFFRDLGGASSVKLGSARAVETTPSKLVEGLGMDARRYIEGLLSLNR